jgi:LMBR1 domain-containing protein 1
MVDVTLVVTSVLFAILIIVASIYFVVYFQHPSDENNALFPKIIVVPQMNLYE